MQSAVTNGAASRAHRILDAAISAGLAPEGNLAIAERAKDAEIAHINARARLRRS